MQLYIWRHPKPKQVQGLCFGQSEVAIDRRKIKRLANQIDSYTKKHQLPKQIYVSPLQRSMQVGLYLQQLGFDCQIDERLMETNFGDWEGKPWSQISKDEIDKWCDDFAHFAPVGGESLNQLFERVRAWLNIRKIEAAKSKAPILAVGHAGWITTAKMVCAGKEVPSQAKDWPRPVGYCQLSVLEF